MCGGVSLPVATATLITLVLGAKDEDMHLHVGCLEALVAQGDLGRLFFEPKMTKILGRRIGLEIDKDVAAFSGR